MAYTHDLKQLIRRVEEARPQRLAKRREGWEFPRLNLAEKEDRLKQFHPSYKEGSLQELSIGPSKGGVVSLWRYARYWNHGVALIPIRAIYQKLLLKRMFWSLGEEGLGAMFDKNPDGSFKVLHLGGTCRKKYTWRPISPVQRSCEPFEMRPGTERGFRFSNFYLL